MPQPTNAPASAAWRHADIVRLVARPRLLEVLDRHRVVLLRSPIGFGKSSLVRYWAETRSSAERDAVQVAVAAGTPAHRFWHDVAEALDAATLDTGPVTAPAGTIEACLERLLARERAVTLVVDDIGRVVGSGGSDDDTGPIAGLLTLLDVVPDLRLVAAAREGFHLSLSRPAPGPLDLLAARARVIGGREMLFTVDELAEVCADAGLPDAAAQAHRLYDVVGGWPRAMRSLVRSLGTDTPGTGVRETAARVIRAHLNRDVLPELEPEEAERLAVLGVPRRLTGGSAAAALGLPEPVVSAMLARMSRAGLIGSVEGGGEPRYVMPRSMRDCLHAEVARDPQRLAAVDRALARHHLERGDLTTAIEHGRDAGDGALVAAAIRSSWLPLLVYHGELLADVLRTAPASWCAADPVLRGLRAFVQWLPGPADGRDHDPLAGFTAASPDLRTALELAMLDVLCLRRAHRRRDALELAEDARRLAMDAMVTQPLHVRDLIAPLALVGGILNELGGDVREAIAVLECGEEHASASVLPGSARHLGAHRAMDHALLGEYDEARLSLRRTAAAPLVGGWISGRAVIGSAIAEALTAVGHLDAPAAHAAQEALRSTGGDPLDEMWPFITYSRALYALVFGSPLAGLQEIVAERATRAADRSTGDLEPLVRSVEIDLLLALGQLDRAAALLGSRDDPRLGATAARGRLLLGDTAGALALARSRLTGLRLSARASDELSVIAAVAELRLGNASAAAAQVRGALRSVPRTAPLAFALVPRKDLFELAGLAPELGEVVDLLASSGTADLYPVNYPVNDEVVRLTRRENIVLRHLAAGLTRAEIAAALVVSPNTVKTQTHSIYRKLGVRSRQDAVRIAREQRLIDGSETPLAHG